MQLMSDKGEYQEAMETLKKALKLEPSTKVRYTALLGGHVCSLITCTSLCPVSEIHPLHTDQGLFHKESLTIITIQTYSLPEA